MLTGLISASLDIGYNLPFYMACLTARWLQLIFSTDRWFLAGHIGGF